MKTSVTNCWIDGYLFFFGIPFDLFFFTKNICCSTKTNLLGTLSIGSVFIFSFLFFGELWINQRVNLSNFQFQLFLKGKLFQSNFVAVMTRRSSPKKPMFCSKSNSLSSSSVLESQPQVITKLSSSQRPTRRSSIS